jgi:hypothetical protein
MQAKQDVKPSPSGKDGLRKAYSSPRMVKFGTIRELTLGGVGGGMDPLGKSG